MNTLLSHCIPYVWSHFLVVSLLIPPGYELPPACMPSLSFLGTHTLFQGTPVNGCPPYPAHPLTPWHQYFLTQPELHGLGSSLHTGAPFCTNTLLTLPWFLTPTPGPPPLSSSWCELLLLAQAPTPSMRQPCTCCPFFLCLGCASHTGMPCLGFLLILPGLQLHVFSNTDAFLTLLTSDAAVTFSLPNGFKTELARKGKCSTFFGAYIR